MITVSPELVEDEKHYSAITAKMAWADFLAYVADVLDRQIIFGDDALEITEKLLIGQSFGI